MVSHPGAGEEAAVLKAFFSPGVVTGCTNAILRLTAEQSFHPEPQSAGGRALPELQVALVTCQPSPTLSVEIPLQL